MGILYRNAANLVVLLRMALALFAVALLGADDPHARQAGLVVLAFAALLDGVDGYLARRLSIVSRVGGLLDTLGDRVTENVWFVFLACEGLVPLVVPVVFLTRSFLADFVRSLHDRRGVTGTFAMNTSLLGRALVASPASRGLYLALKFAVFLGAGVLLAYRAPESEPASASGALLGNAVYWGAVLATGVNLLRFVVLLHDSRAVLREEFGG